MKLLLTDCATLQNDNDLPLDGFEKFGDVTYFDCITRDELLEAVSDVDIILCNKTVIDKEVMDRAKKLSYIGLFATGYNNIDTDEARARGIVVCNAGSYSTSAVAQQVFAYILNRYNAVEKYDNFVKSGGWKKSSTFSKLCFPTDELRGKTIGIIGYGSIGKRVAEIALAFEMNVTAFTRTPKEDSRVRFVTDLTALLANSDIVTVHCPLNPDSIDMFNRYAFSKMKPDSFFINTARGGVVDEQALRDALTSGHLAGAAVDVLKEEPMREDCVLADAPNITITPHTGWAPLTTRKRLLKIVEDNITAFLDNNPINVVV